MATPGSSRDGRTLADLVTDQLSPYLGPNTARVAVRTFALRTLGVKPEEMKMAEAPRLLEALRPVLKTLLGEAAATTLDAQIREATR